MPEYKIGDKVKYKGWDCQLHEGSNPFQDNSDDWNKLEEARCEREYVGKIATVIDAGQLDVEGVPNLVVEFEDGQTAHFYYSEVDLIDPDKKYHYASQLKIDILYDDHEEMESMVKAILDINKNKEWNVEIPPQSEDTEEMTEHYKSQLITANDDVPKIKTKKEWDISGKTLTDYLDIGSEVDDNIVDYFIGVMPPIITNIEKRIIQIGEPFDNIDNGYTYATISKNKDGVWKYKGTCHSGTTLNRRRHNGTN